MGLGAEAEGLWPHAGEAQSQICSQNELCPLGALNMGPEEPPIPCPAGFRGMGGVLRQRDSPPQTLGEPLLSLSPLHLACPSSHPKTPSPSGGLSGFRCSCGPTATAAVCTGKPHGSEEEGENEASAWVSSSGRSRVPARLQGSEGQGLDTGRALGGECLP